MCLKVPSYNILHEMKSPDGFMYTLYLFTKVICHVAQWFDLAIQHQVVSGAFHVMAFEYNIKCTTGHLVLDREIKHFSN